MSEWVVRDANTTLPDLEVLQESALAMAQAVVQNAINQSEISRADLAKRMGRPRSFVSRMLNGSHNLTVKTLALALAACGKEPRFSFVPIQWGWAKDVPESATCAAPTYGGQFDDDTNGFLSDLPIGSMAA